jgi:phage replication O-like protein O
MATNNTYGNPQKEDGYTPIANELLEAILIADFSKRQILIIMAIARMTFGFSKKSDALSSVQIANITGINRPKVSETLRELIDKNVVIKHDSGRKAHGHFVNQISINKHYKTWLFTDTKMAPDNRYQNGTGTKTVSDTETVPPTDTKMGTEQVPKRDTHKTNKTIKQYIPRKYKIRVPIPSDFGISKRVEIWAIKNQHKDLDIHLESFVNNCQSKGYKYIDWCSAFMEAIRSNWAKVEVKKPNEILKGML